ncbi:KICSTOR complex protein kaptin isoform X2 [Neocloeon triangulifer]|uniref:KICSTOR complex protein kaptin isoform X2 n=1 Tax=Neocloeon triangulifer TaxID=2078957 RepID=UPI00286F48C7|nr:KICSTOR complex protein kaptin isoform X2 [Neocloeon triangulifer]
MSKINFVDAHYSPMISQGNVYTLTKLEMASGLVKLMVASLKRKVFFFEYCDVGGHKQSTVKEVPFTYIPSGAEIIAMDAFNKSSTSDDFVIGITIVKQPDPRVSDAGGIKQSSEMYFNIYSEWETSSQFNLENIAQNCFSLELSFIPYHLFHTHLPNTKEFVWLLSGSDEKIHLYREDKLNHCYQEISLHEFFPELVDLSAGIILWMDIVVSVEQDKRITALASENGSLSLSVVDIASRSVLFTHSSSFSGPLSSVRLFTIDEESLNLVVTSTLTPSAVYMNVIKEGLGNFVGLQDSGNFDCALCSLVADIDMDGQPEILIGTYGQELLVYKHVSNEWVLWDQMTLSSPIYSLLYIDMTSDGMKELVALTLKGVYIVQHFVDDVLKILKKRLELVCPESNK